MTDPHATQLFATVTTERGVVTAHLVGPSIGQREGPVIAGMIEKALEAEGDVAWIVLNFADVSFINSAGIGSCVSIHNTAKARNARVVLHAMHDNIREVFKMTKLDRIFKVTDDEKKLGKLVGR